MKRHSPLMEPSVPDRLLGTSQVAMRLGVNVKTVRTWAREGILKGGRVGKKLWKFRSSDVDAFLQRVLEEDDADDDASE